MEDSEWNNAVADGRFKRIVNGTFHLSDLSRRGNCILCTLLRNLAGLKLDGKKFVGY